MLTNTFEHTAYKQRTVERGITLGPTATKFITVILIAVAALFYLVQQTQSATKNYQLQEKKIEKEALLKESERLKVEAIRLQSLDNTTKGAENLGLEQTNSVNYFDAN
ncbi:MAG: hypothetical protein WCW17_02815 [Patescibacteria group bacterium]|jgi:hypothetical protein